MRKVVDSNFLQTPKLEAYLAKSERNCVVLTDYAAMEAYKGDTLASIYKSMQVVSRYPRQVIVLKGTQTICGLSGRAAGLQRRLIDERETSQFGDFCREMRAKQGEPKYIVQLLEKGRQATAHIERLLTDAAKMASHLENLTREFTQAELRVLRTQDRLSKWPSGL